MYTKIKIKHIAIGSFLFFSTLSYAQSSAGSSTITSQNSNGFSLGFYGGPNITWVKQPFFDEYIPPSLNAGIGSDYTLAAKINLYKGLFFSTGISYEIQVYQTNSVGGSTILPQFNIPVTYSVSAYNIGIPLILGKGISTKKWSFSAGLGIEFYYNFEGKATETNTSPPVTDYFFKGRIASTPLGSINDYLWDAVGAFGVLQTRVDYKISPRLSISCMPVFRCTDPFAQETYFGSFLAVGRYNTFSLNAGINYNFSNKYLNGDYPDGNDEKEKRFSIGFSIIPTDIINKITPLTGAYFYPHTNNRFSFSYGIPFQYDVSRHISLESGIAIDNFNFLALSTNVLIGLPIIVKYYFPLDENQNNSLYIGLGCHFDYPTNLGWLYYPAHSYILPLALCKVGYRRIIGKNYYFDANIGYEGSLNNTQSLQGNYVFIGAEPEITGLPRYIFSSVGFGCML